MMKSIKLSILGLFLYSCMMQPLAGATLSDVLSQDVESGKISAIESIYLQGLALKGTEYLPQEYQQAADKPIKCGFGIITDVLSNWDRFSADQQQALISLISRPEMEQSYVTPSGHFMIHYDTSGKNMPLPYEDNDQSGIPDYIESAGRIADSVYTIEVDQMGYDAPPVDDYMGSQYDIYIVNLQSVYGYTEPEHSVGGNRWTSYIQLDNNYEHTPTKGLDALRVTMAHEYFHAIQMGIVVHGDPNTYEFDDLFIMEASSTWMEDGVFDGINDYYYYLNSFFRSTNQRFDLVNQQHEYGLCLWFHFLEAKFSDRISRGETVKRTWEALRDYQGLLAIDMMLYEMGMTFRDALTEFYAWNYLTGSRAYPELFYPEGAYYPQIQPDKTFTFNSDTVISQSVYPTASRYYVNSTQNESIAIIPVNIDNYQNETLSSFVLNLSNDNYWPGFTDIETGKQMKISGKEGQEDIWNVAAVVWLPGEEPEIIIARSGEETVENTRAIYPNPFQPAVHYIATIPFPLKEAAWVSCYVVTSSGHLVWSQERYFNDDMIDENGTALFLWNGENTLGNPVSSGVYLCFVQVDEKQVLKTPIVILR